MRRQLSIVFCVLILVAIAADAKKPLKQKKVPPQEESPNAIEDEPQRDPCSKHRCGHGKECFFDQETNKAKCRCVSECAEPTDLRRRVCSNYNTTWQSDCHLHRHRCVCLEGSSVDCTEEHKHMHIDYYGECQDIAKCEAEVLEDFPRRMREWLYTIMSTRIPKPSSLEAEDDGSEVVGKWVDAVIWKYCDLDKHPTDRTVSRHELFPLRAPLLSLEPCISDFLNNCDVDTDHKITLTEWGQCLGAPENELEDKCTQFKALFNDPESQ